jgi:flavin-dependent dehydrogenase
MSAERVEVLVIGAGPAGAMAALACARSGADVLLVERAEWPRAKVCGGCVNLHAAAVLAAAGLPDLLPGSAAIPLTRLRVGARGRSARVDLPGGWAISRDEFDGALVAAARARGAEFRCGTRATDLGLDGAARRVRVGEREVRAAVVIDARGLAASGPPRAGSRIGAGVILESSPAGYGPGTIHMACDREGYVGLVVVSRGRLEVAAAFDALAVRDAGGAGPLAARVVAAAGLPAVPGLAAARWRGTPPLTRRAGELAGPRWFRVGDSAAFVEPFTGQGMAWALAGGAAVTDVALTAARRWNDDLPRKWAETWSAVVGRRQRECAALASLLRRPRLTTALVSLVGRVPALAGPVVRSINRKGAA